MFQKISLIKMALNICLLRTTNNYQERDNPLALTVNDDVDSFNRFDNHIIYFKIMVIKDLMKKVTIAEDGICYHVSWRRQIDMKL